PKLIQPNQQARLAIETVTRFCYSADTTITKAHLPKINGIDTREDRETIASVIVPMARRAWADLSRPDGTLRFIHDVYVKMFALSEPTIDCDVLLVDEAQDVNPALGGLVMGQNHVQRVAVGDANQAIYGWRGAEDFLS